MIEKTDRITRNTNLSIEKVNLIKLTLLFYPDQNFPFERGDRGPPFSISHSRAMIKGGCFPSIKYEDILTTTFSIAISQNRYALIPLIGDHSPMQAKIPDPA